MNDNTPPQRPTLITIRPIDVGREAFEPIRTAIYMDVLETENATLKETITGTRICCVYCGFKTEPLGETVTREDRWKQIQEHIESCEARYTKEGIGLLKFYRGRAERAEAELARLQALEGADFDRLMKQNADLTALLAEVTGERNRLQWELDAAKA